MAPEENRLNSSLRILENAISSGKTNKQKSRLLGDSALVIISKLNKMTLLNKISVLKDVLLKTESLDNAILAF